MKKYIDYLRQFIGLGSGGSGGGGFMPAGSITITKNGQHKVTQYTDAIVNVPNPSKGKLYVKDNGEYDVTKRASVEVDVPPYGRGTKTIKRNNANENVNTYATANVQVQGGDDGTTSMTVTCPSGYTEIRTTNTQSEFTVNNWKVGNRTSSLKCPSDAVVAKNDKVGYIGLKYGTKYEFCVYGTVYSVTSYSAYKNIVITIEGVIHGDDPTINISANGTYDVKGRNSAVVNVPSGGGGGGEVVPSGYTIKESSRNILLSFVNAMVPSGYENVEVDSTTGATISANDLVCIKAPYASSTSSSGTVYGTFYVWGSVVSITNLTSYMRVRLSVAGFIIQPTKSGRVQKNITANGNYEVLGYTNVYVNMETSDFYAASNVSFSAVPTTGTKVRMTLRSAVDLPLNAKVGVMGTATTLDKEYAVYGQVTAIHSSTEYTINVSKMISQAM